MSKNTALGFIASLLLGGVLGYGLAYSKPTPDGYNSMSGMNHGGNTATTDLEKLSGDDFDKKFVELMIDHHQGAIDMANLSASRAKHQDIKTLSDEIISAQSKEIEMMKGWLNLWGY